MNHALRFNQVSKTFGDHQVLKRLDGEVEAGEAFALVGANGAGKTTLMKAILDYSPPSGGSIEIFGQAVQAATARKRLAFLPERFSPPYFLRGMDFLNYAARLYGVSPTPALIAKLLDVVELDSKALQKSVAHYSKGMVQKLGLMAVFQSGRELLLLDEPLSGLDPAARASIKNYLLELREAGHTLFFSTHLLADVAQLSDRLGILHAGDLRFVGSPQYCLQTYQTDDLEVAYLRCIQAACAA